MSRRTYVVSLMLVGTLIVVQSAVHLVAVLSLDRVGSIVDLDRSNGVPDVVSTLVLVAAALGAAMLGRAGARIGWVASVALVGVTLADIAHDGAHPSTGRGKIVTCLVVVTVGSLVALLLQMRSRPRATMVAAIVLIGASLLVSGLDHVDQWFERARPELGAEAQIVAKEGLELAGWSFVALALWDETLGRRRVGRRPSEA